LARNHTLGIIYVSHRLPEVLEVTDRITVLRDGINQGTYDRAEKKTRNTGGSCPAPQRYMTPNRPVKANGIVIMGMDISTHRRFVMIGVDQWSRSSCQERLTGFTTYPLL